ncbi:MAG: DNA polymerase III subunit beta [Flavobacteriales bacterium]
MQFVVSSKTLLSHIQTLMGVIQGGNNSVPILQDFLFQTNPEGGLKVTASDLETTVIAVIPEVSIKTEGQVAIPARFLVDILKTFADVPLSITVDPATHGINIHSDSGKYKTAGHDAEEFPSLPEFNSKGSFAVEALTFNNAVAKTIFAAGNDELRPVMSGVLLQASPDSANFVATDAHKLVLYKRFDIKGDSSFELILNKRPLNLLKNILGNSEESLSIEYSDKNVRFSFGHYVVYSRLIEGKYPAYEAVIPKENPNVLTIDRHALLNGLKRVSIFSNKATYLVRLKLAGNHLEIIAEDLDFSNSAKEELNCQYSGEDMEIGFNSRFLIEMLSNMDQESVTLKMSTPSRPGILSPSEYQQDIEEITMLMMPIMVN